MGILKYIFGKKERNILPFATSMNISNYATISEANAMNLSVVYRCVDLIGNSVALLPIDLFDANKNKVKNRLSYVLNLLPNECIDRYTFIKLLISSMLLRGDAYAYIERDKDDNVVALHYIDSLSVSTKVVTDGVKKLVFYMIEGKTYETSLILHFINYTYDGISGVSTIRSAINSIKLAGDGEASALGFYNGGCNLGGVLSVKSQLNKEQITHLKEEWKRTFNTLNGTPNGVAVISGDMQYLPISVNPVDAQLLESRKYSVVDICRFFGVSPTKAFDLTHSSYSTVEAEGLLFLTDTILPILSKLECELNIKLLKPSERNRMTIKFDTSVILRTDKSSLAQYYSTLFNIGVLSLNEIRDTLDLPSIEGGNKHYVLVNLMNSENGTQISNE